MSAHAPTPPEKSNPVIWTVALVGFVAVVCWWFAHMFGSGVHIANQHPLEIPAGATGPAEPDHAALIAAMADGNAELFKQGRAVYGANCTACHGADGGANPANPAARQFIGQSLLNGTDPYSMYLTLKDGYNGMPPQAGLSGEEKYAVIHYIREAFFKTANESQYVAIDDTYLAEGGPNGPFPAPGGAAVGPAVRGADYVVAAPIAGAMAERADAVDAEAVAAARERILAAAAGSEPEVASALRRLAADESAGRYALVLVGAAAQGPEAVTELLTDPGRNSYQPVLALLPKDRLAALAAALQEGR